MYAMQAPRRGQLTASRIGSQTLTLTLLIRRAETVRIRKLPFNSKQELEYTGQPTALAVVTTQGALIGNQSVGNPCE